MHLNGHYVNSSQDDYFLIGPTDRKSGLSIAYPNRLKRRMAQKKPSDDEPLHIPLEKKDVKKNVNKIIRGRRNEGIQTNCPRSTLQREIQLIRDEIERQKLKHRQPSAAYDKNERLKESNPRQSKHGNKAEQVSQLPLNVISDKVTDDVLEAPRTVKQQLRKDLNEYAKQEPEDFVRKKRAVSLHRPYRLTEYQRAFRTPAMPYRPQSRKIIKDPLIPLKRTNELYKCGSNYTSEYMQQYKPFKYVTEGELASNIPINTELECHIVPIRRPRSAYSEPADKALTNTKLQQKRRAKTLTNDHSKTRPHSTRFITEYNAMYHTHDQQSIWSDTISQHRQHACEYRQRNQTSHFSAEHLAQLDSNYVDLWDAPSTDRYAEKYGKQQYLSSLPAAGRSTITGQPLHSDDNNKDSSLQKARQWAMLSGQEVANILNPTDDVWSGQSDVTSMYTNPKCYDFARMARPHTADSGAVESARRLNDCTECCTARQSWGNQTVTLKPKEDQVPMSIGVSDDVSISDLSSPECLNTKRHHRRKKCRKSANDRSTSPSSPSPISPLSNRSIRCSASTASETLERARRQRDRVLPQYHTERYQPNMSHHLGASC